jgi:hypothetical protein
MFCSVPKSWNGWKAHGARLGGEFCHVGSVFRGIKRLARRLLIDKNLG